MSDDTVDFVWQEEVKITDLNIKKAKIHPNDLNHASVLSWPERIIYRASAIGGCPRALWAARNGYEGKPITAKFQAIFARGYEIEDITKTILESMGYKIFNNGYEVHVDLGPIAELRPVWILGHIDCDTRTVDDPQMVLTEIKGFGKDYLDRYLQTGIEGFPLYTHQITSYLKARTQSRWRFVIYQKTHPSDEDSPTRLIIRDYELPPIPFETVKKKVEQIELVSTTDPSLVTCSNLYPCEYRYLHTEKEYVDLQPHQLALVTAIKSFDEKMEKLEAIKGRFRAQLEKQLSPTVRYRGGDWSVYFGDKPSRMDQKKVKEIMREAGVSEDEYMVKGEGKVMTIRAKENKEK